MAKRGKRANAKRKTDRKQTLTRAPRDERLGRTSRWTLTEIIPIWVSAGNYQQALEQSTIRVSTHLNGMYVQVLNQNLQNLFQYQNLYGVATGQFKQLADLYEQYRLLNVSLDWRQADTWGVYTQPPPLAWIDPSSASNYPLSIEEWARAPDPRIGMKNISMSQPYERWLDENLDHAFLQTIDPSNPSSREQYEKFKAPGINLWQIFSPLQTTTDNFVVLGHLVIRVHYEFRGTRTNGEEAV